MSSRVAVVASPSEDPKRPIFGKGRTDSELWRGEAKLAKDDSAEFKSTDLRTKAFDPLTVGGAYSQLAMSLRLTANTSLTHPYLQNVWVNACVRIRAWAAASVPFVLYDGEERVEKSRVLDLLGKAPGGPSGKIRRPNPLQGQKKFWVANSYIDSLWGECFWVLVSTQGGVARPIDEGGYPDEIWPVRGDQVQEVIDPETKLPYAWDINGYRYPAHSVVQVAQYDPYSPLRGSGPMTALMRTAGKDLVIDRYDEALLKNGGSPGGTITFDGVLKPEDSKALERSWNEHMNSPEGTRKTPILPLGMKFDQFGFNPKDMEFTSMRSWNRESIMAVFQVTRAVMGLTDGLNYASAYESRRIFGEFLVFPTLDLLANEIESQWLAHIDGPENRYSVKFDISQVPWMQELVDTKIDRATKVFTMTGRSWKDSCAIAGLEVVPTDGDEERWVPQGMGIPPDQQIKIAQARPAAVVGVAKTGDLGVKTIITETDGPVGVSAEEYWDTYNAAIEPYDEKVAKRIHRVFREYLVYVRAQVQGARTKHLNGLSQKIILTHDEIESLIQTNLERWAKELDDAVGPLWKQLYEAGAGSLDIGAVFMHATDPMALDFLKAKSLQLAEGPFSTLAMDIRSKILETLATTNPDIMGLANAIENRLEQLKADVESMIDSLPARALKIARTENTSIYSGARMQNMQLAGIRRHQWVTARDEHVRKHHQELEGKVAVVGQSFGFGLRFPGDPQARAGEVVSCRCATAPILDELVSTNRISGMVSNQ